MNKPFESKILRAPIYGPLSAHTSDYVALLKERGYRPAATTLNERLIRNLSAWMARNKYVAADLSEEALGRFMRYHMKSRSTHLEAKWAGLRRFLAMLRADGVVAPKLMHVPACSPAQRLIDDFGRHLSEERGYARTTVAGYASMIRPFLATWFSSYRGAALAEMDAAAIVEYVRRHVRGHTRVHSQFMTTALRSLFRFWRYRGLITSDLASAVPKVASWTLAGLPKHLPPGTVRQILARCDRKSPMGKRDYAIVLILARLGLRSCEVTRLRLEDFDWEQGRITIRSRKGGGLVYLPLPQDAGQAVVRYLQHARPPCTCREVFVRWLAPVGRLSPSAVGNVARKAITRAGVTNVCRGAHTFRHTLATDLLRRGASLFEIGRILRHKDPSTTAIYAKLDLRSLRALAMRWPGGAR